MGNFFTRRDKDVPVEHVEGNPLKVVIISDTHNDHRSLDIPDGDILIHGGDFTNFGKIEHAYDFNQWLGTLPHRHKVVINGNHESNASWKDKTKEILSNATFLKQESLIVYRSDGSPVKIYGTEFSWPVREGSHPYYDQVDEDTVILVAHSPVDGFVDGGHGCPALKRRCEVLRECNLRLVVGGHIHSAHGSSIGSGACRGIQFVNASICGSARKAAHDPIIITI